MTPTRAFWARVPSWLRATVTSAAQALLGAVLLTVLGVIDDLAKVQPVDWWGVLDDLRTQALIFAHAVVVAVWRWNRPPEQSYPPADG